MRNVIGDTSFLLLLVLCCAFLQGCNTDRDRASFFGPSQSGILVVDALLVVDQPLPDLYVRETVGPDERYTLAGSAVTNAEVAIEQGGEVYSYRPDSTEPGRYLPPIQPATVLPQTEYRLQVRSDGREITGKTVTPARFQILEGVLLNSETLQVDRSLKTFKDGEDQVFGAPENQVIYQEGFLEARFEAVDVPAFQVGVVSLDRNSERVLEADFLDEQDYADLEREVSSPALEAQDGNLRLPWFAVYFACRHLISIFALDDNWFDVIRSSTEFQEGNFGGLAGDNFEVPLFRLDGGIGLFGSAAMDSLGFVVLPKER